MRRNLSLPLLIGIFVFTALAVWMYRDTSSYLLGKWGMDDFTYSYFIPLVVGYLIWEKRGELAELPSQKSWVGLVPATLGILLFWMGELGGEYTIMFISLWLLAVGSLWSLFGWRKLKVIAFPVALTLAMIPPPVVIYSSLTLRLKLLSSQIGVLMLQVYGMSAYREGNVIDVGFTKLQVVDACSGLRYFFPLIVLAVLLAYFFKGAVWKKVLIVLSAIPVSIVTNAMRIASVGILYQFMGAAAAEGFFHDFSGWFIFMISLGILLLEMALLKRILPDRSPGRPEDSSLTSMEVHSPESVAYGGILRFVSLQFVIIVLLMGVSAAAVQGVAHRDKTPLKKPFSAFPDTLGEWTARKQALEKMYLDALELNDYLLADFRNSRGELINSYVAYNDFQVKGKASHSPSSCLPGSGWELQRPERITISGANGRKLTINRALMVMGNDRRLTYYWFDQRGRVLTGLMQIKLYNFVDSVTHNRTDGALVRLITPLNQSETPEKGDERLIAFLAYFEPALAGFLPDGPKR